MAQRFVPTQWSLHQAWEAGQIELAIAALRDAVGPGLDAIISGTYDPNGELNFDEIWDEIHHIQSMFDRAPLDDTDRKWFWHQFNEICDWVREAQAARSDRWSGERDDSYETVAAALRDLEARFQLGDDAVADPLHSPTKGFSNDARSVSDLMRSLTLRRSDRDEMKEWLDRLWARMKERNLAKHEAWLSSQNERLDRIEAALERSRAQRERLCAEYDDLVRKRDAAWADSFRERAARWLDEKNARIEQVDEKIGSLEKQASDIRQRIGMAE